MTTTKVGLTRITMTSGWPVDRETTQRSYEEVEHVPIVEQYDAPAFINTETYRDWNGDVRTREWTDYERRERQTGVDVVRHNRTSSHTVGRVRYDDGRVSAAFTSPTWLRQGVRYHHVAYAHPLLRGGDSFAVSGDGTIRAWRTKWRRLTTWRATREVLRMVAADRNAMLAAIPPGTPLMRADALQRDWQVCDGHWMASSARLRTARGEVALPGSTRHLKDGEIVTATVRCLAKGDFVEQWASAATIDRPHARWMSAPSQYVAELWRPAAMLAAAAAITGMGIHLQNGLVAIVGVVFGGLTIRAMSSNDQLASKQYGTRSHALKDGRERMMRRMWMYARSAYDRRNGR